MWYDVMWYEWECDHRELSEYTHIVNKFLILNFGKFLQKGGPLPQNSKNKYFMIFDIIWVYSESSRWENHEYMLFI